MTNNLVNIVQSKQKIFKKYEVTILLITALCHDINHKGKTNTYLKKCNSHNNVITIDEYETWIEISTFVPYLTYGEESNALLSALLNLPIMKVVLTHQLLVVNYIYH